jgi:hypothetical protein
LENEIKVIWQTMMKKDVEPAPCSRTALVLDRFIDEIKTTTKTSQKKVDPDVWDTVVQRMKDKEKRKI